MKLMTLYRKLCKTTQVFQMSVSSILPYQLFPFSSIVLTVLDDDAAKAMHMLYRPLQRD